MRNSCFALAKKKSSKETFNLIAKKKIMKIKIDWALYNYNKHHSCESKMKIGQWNYITKLKIYITIILIKYWFSITTIFYILYVIFLSQSVCPPTDSFVGGEMDVSVPGALYLAVVPDTAKLRRPWYKPRTAAFLPSDFTGLVFPAMECLAFGISEGKKMKIVILYSTFPMCIKKM